MSSVCFSESSSDSTASSTPKVATPCHTSSQALANHRLRKKAALEMDKRFPGFNYAIDSVHPLTVHLKGLGFRQTINAGRTLCRIQKIAQLPYPPPSPQVLNISKNSILMATLRLRYLQALCAYPPSNLARFGIVLKATTSEEAIPLLMGSRRFEIITANWDALPHRPAHFVAVDLDTKAVCVCIRGSVDVSDWVTNLCLTPTEDGRHEGMQSSAVTLDAILHRTIQKILDERPDYSLVLLGHSLGGGVSTLLGILWHETRDFARFSNGELRISVYAFCPPCVVVRELSVSSRYFVNSIIFGRDPIARASWGSLFDFLVKINIIARAPRGPSRWNRRVDSPCPSDTESPDSNFACSRWDPHNAEMKAHGGLDYSGIEKLQEFYQFNRECLESTIKKYRKAKSKVEKSNDISKSRSSFLGRSFLDSPAKKIDKSPNSPLTPQSPSTANSQGVSQYRRVEPVNKPEVQIYAVETKPDGQLATQTPNSEGALSLDFKEMTVSDETQADSRKTSEVESSLSAHSLRSTGVPSFLLSSCCSPSTCPRADPYEQLNLLRNEIRAIATNLQKVGEHYRMRHLYPGGRCLLLVPICHLEKLGGKPVSPEFVTRGRCCVVDLGDGVFDEADNLVFNSKALQDHYVNRTAIALELAIPLTVPKQFGVSKKDMCECWKIK